MFGSVIAGRLTDTYGRRSVMQVVAFLFALTCLGTALANGFVTFFIIRFLGGLAVGAVSVVSPMYIAEVSPPHLRGRLVSVYQLSIVTGIVLSYFINYLLKDLDDNWRWMFATGIVPSVVFPWGLDNFRTITFAIIALMALGQLIFTIKIIPETKNKTLEEIEAYWKT